MARLVAHLGDPPRHESLFTFPTCPNSYALLKSIVVAECGLHPSGASGGERPDEFGPKKSKRVEQTYIRCCKMSYLPCSASCRVH